MKSALMQRWTGTGAATVFQVIEGGEDGEESTPSTLYELWRDRRTIVTFLRHFGCRNCVQQIAAINTFLVPAVDRHNESHPDNAITLVAIGFGTMKDAKMFAKKYPFDGELYVDTSVVEPASYRLFSLRQNEDTIFKAPGVFRDEVVAMMASSDKAGFKDFTATRNPKGVLPEANVTKIFTRVGGMFVLGPGNTCDFAHRSAYAGDMADLSQVLAAATGLETDGEKQHIYPSTQAWVKRLGSAEPYVPRADSDVRSSPPAIREKDDSENYLQSLRDDAEGRVKSVDGSHPGAEEDAEAQRAKLLRKAFLEKGAPPKTMIAALAKAMRLSAKMFIGLFVFSVYKFITGREPSIVTWKDFLGEYWPFILGMIATNILSSMLERLAAEKDAEMKKKKNIAEKSDAGSLRCPAVDIKLLTPNEIDSVAEELGDIKCDCNFVEETDVSNIAEQRERAASSVDDYSFMCPDTSTDPTSRENIKHLLEVNCYMREFLAKPHPLVGRKGPVCPFVPGALRMKTLYFSVVRTDGLSTRDTIAKVRSSAKSFVSRFHKLEPTTGKKTAYKAVVLVFPDVHIDKAPQVIDDVQMQLKPDFVAKGLMIGEFHRQNNSCGLRNESFFPLRTPQPALAIRRIVPTDLVFLSPTKYAPSLRLKFLESYLEQFEGDKSATAKKSVAEATKLLEQCKEELGNIHETKKTK